MEPVVVNTLWCKGCGICVAFCPKQALELKKGKSTPIPGRCIACGMCEMYCPDLAITVDKSKKPKKGKPEEGGGGS
jgi:2-oxoglutarate ferredoxin oxidoreductase subunit delta